MKWPHRRARALARRVVARVGTTLAVCGLVVSAHAADALGPPPGPWDQAVIDSVFAAVPGQENLHGRVSWGVTRTVANADGVVLLELEPAHEGGPLARAGCYPGDVVLAVNGLPIRTPADLTAAIRRSRPLTPVNVLVAQAGRRSLRTVVPGGALRLAVRELPPVVTVPGVPPMREPDRTDAGPAGINVLEAVAIDRTSGAVEVVGRYDPTYRTGPIDYLDLLKTAAATTAPRLSLQSDVEWSQLRPATGAGGTVRVLLALPAAEHERQQLLRAIPAAFGISAEDYATLHDYGWFARDKRLPPPPAVARAMTGFLRHLGWDDVAVAYERLCDATVDGFLAALVASGRADVAEAARGTSGLSEPRAFNALANRACIAIMERLGLPATEARRLVSATEGGADDVRAMLDKLHQDLPGSARDARGRFPMEAALAAISVGDAATRILADYRAPIPVRIETVDVERTSLLARIMYAADYVGKLSMVRSDLFAALPGHESIYQYTGRRLAALDARQRALVLADRGQSAYWFAPTRVELRASADRSLVTFGESRVEARTARQNATEGRAALPAADATLLENFNQGWCDQFTEHYDRYATVLPELHALREAAKVVALAAWARAQDVRLELDAIRQERWQPPDEIMGFARSGTICVAASVGDGPYEEVSLLGSSAATGGVSFAAPHDWIVVEEASHGDGDARREGRRP